MKKNVVLLLIVLLLASCISTMESNNFEQQPSTHDFIGNWILETKGSYGEVTYFQNKTAIVKIYISNKKDNFLMELEFEWWVNDDMFFQKYKRTISKAPGVTFPENYGVIQKFKITKLTDSIFIITDETGANHTMSKK